MNLVARFFVWWFNRRAEQELDRGYGPTRWECKPELERAKKIEELMKRPWPTPDEK